MTSTLPRRLAAAACGLAAVVTTVAVAAPASAETFSKSDPAGDVASIDGERPGVTNGDIRRTKFAHARRDVTVRASFRNLAKKGDGIEQYVRVDTPAKSYQIFLVAGPGDWRGDLDVFGSGGSDDSCRGADFRLDYGRDVFTLAVPRGCLGTPRWVRVGLGTVTGFRGNEQGVRVDDALKRGFAFEDDDVRLSPRLSRAGRAYTG